MATTRRRWPFVLAGAAVFLVVLVVALVVVGTMFFRNNVQVAHGASRESALAAFDAAKQPFPDARPVLVMGDDRRPVFAQGLESRHNPGTVTSLRVLAWDADDGALADITLPLWLLRLKSGPIRFGEYVSGMEERGVQLETKDLDRYGPGILLEFAAPDGDRVLLTAQ